MVKNRVIYKKVCLIGLGPAGIGFVNEFLNSKHENNLIGVDLGKNIYDRSLIDSFNQSTNDLVSGFGGAALFSGGKLSLYPAGKNLKQIIGDTINVEQELESLLAEYKEHLTPIIPINDDESIEDKSNEYIEKGFDYKYYEVIYFRNNELFKYYQELFNLMQNSKVEILSNSVVYNISKRNDGYLVQLMQKNLIIEIICEKVVLGVGRLGKKLIETINTNFNLNGHYSRIDCKYRLKTAQDYG